MFESILAKFRTSPTPKLPPANENRPLMSNDRIRELQVAFCRKGRRRQYLAEVKNNTTQALLEWTQKKRA